MSKKRRKTPTTSTLSTRKTEAPMLVTRAPDTTPVAEPPPVAAPVVPAATEQPLDRTQVARLAFAKFAARGYAHGHHVEDWFAAEAELRAARN